MAVAMSGSLPGDILSKAVAIMFSRKLVIGVAVFLFVLRSVPDRTPPTLNPALAGFLRMSE